MFGKVIETPQKENTPFCPRSPYGISKVTGYELTRNYREAYNLFCCSGILFNHESPRRGYEFVTRKISYAVARIKYGLQKELFLGNIKTKRDWGHAKDYVLAMWKMMQKKLPKDYVIATGKQYSVKYFTNLVAQQLKLKIEWKGKGINESGFINGKKRIIIDKNYFRPTEVESLLGNSKKARKELNWKPKYNIKSLIKDMVVEELKKLSDK